VVDTYQGVVLIVAVVLARTKTSRKAKRDKSTTGTAAPEGAPA
jgi:hypothetical protein